MPEITPPKTNPTRVERKENTMANNYTTSSVYEYPNQQNRENVDKATSLYHSEEESKMSAAYKNAEEEYKKGNIKAGDAKVEEGRAAANKAATEYYRKGGAELDKNNCNEKMAKAYYEKGNEIKSLAKDKERELAEARNKAEERSQSPKEGEGRSR